MPANGAELGALLYENWKAREDGADVRWAYEVYLYTDAHVTGERAGDSRIGPVQLLNTVPYGTRKYGHLLASILLRIDDHVSGFIAEELPDMGTTRVGRYHGGRQADEVAALLSLCLGARIKAGEQTRWFESPADNRGRPRAETTRPTLPAVTQGKLLPQVMKTVRLQDHLQLEELLQVDPATTVALVRAALSYQQALWIADSEPELAWLFLVTAIETAAGDWWHADSSPLEQYRSIESAFCRELADLGGEAVIDRVAEKYSYLVRSTRKFIDFVARFGPPAPEGRPPETFCVDWAPEALEATYRTVYGYRSKALHAGTPFPWPMCSPPLQLTDWQAPAEMPGGAAAVGDSVWTQEDLPIYLHTFAYIVRHSLLNWWRNLCGE